MAEIWVEPLSDRSFQVEVVEGDERTRHRVEVAEDERARFGGPDVDAAALVEASFRFLLEREPKESILPRFRLSVIERYFPDYPDEIRRRLGRRA